MQAKSSMNGSSDATSCAIWGKRLKSVETMFLILKVGRKMVEMPRYYMRKRSCRNVFSRMPGI